MNKPPNKILILLFFFLFTQAGFAKVFVKSPFYIADITSYVLEECIQKAGELTEERFSDFDSKQFNSGYDYKIDNRTTRFWYNSLLETFNNEWKPILEEKCQSKEITLKDYAKIAHAIRHETKVIARAHMENSDSLSGVENRDLGKSNNINGATFERFVKEKLEKQKREGKKPNLKEAYRAIIESSTRTNEWVNSFMHCYDYALIPSLRAYFCDAIGNYFVGSI